MLMTTPQQCQHLSGILVQALLAHFFKWASMCSRVFAIEQLVSWTFMGYLGYHLQNTSAIKSCY